jgi:hypothetical protein
MVLKLLIFLFHPSFAVRSSGCPPYKRSVRECCDVGNVDGRRCVFQDVAEFGDKVAHNSIRDKRMEFLAPTTPSKIYPPHTKSLIAPLGIRYATPDKTILSPSSSRTMNTEPNSSLKKSNTKSDRFIPNRNKMDFSYCNYNLLCHVGRGSDDNEDEDGNRAQESKSPNKKLKSEVFQLANHTPGKRMLSCFDSSVEEPDSPVLKVSPPHPNLF